MAEKIFAGLNGKIDSDEVRRDFESSTKLDTVYVGKLGVFFREGFKTRYIAYVLVERAFIRVQEVNLKTCCGGSSTVYFKLVFVSGGKEAAFALSENESAMKQALELIGERAPSVATGYVK